MALSRLKHAIMDVAMPGFVALLWLGHLPSWRLLLLSLLTAASGYIAVYALNDLVGAKVDRAKFAGGDINAGYAVEATGMRHPLAQGLLSMRDAVAWFVFWFTLTLVGAFLLRPVLVLVVVAAAGLEVIYCVLLKLTYWRTLVSGLVKSAGPLAAVFVVRPHPPLPLLLLLLAWLMCWEIGGQNIPADWNDVEEDKRVGAQTIPVVWGLRVAGTLVAVTITLTLVLSMFLPWMSPLRLGTLYRVSSAAAGVFLLVLPALRLVRGHDSRAAAKLFDRASYYPLAQLAIVSFFVLLHRPL